MRFRPDHSDTYELVGNGTCVDEVGLHYNKFRRHGELCENFKTCASACDLFGSKQCHGFELLSLSDSCRFCQLNIQAGFAMNYGGWQIHAGGGGRGRIVSTAWRPRSEYLWCYRRIGNLTNVRSPFP